MDYPLVNYFDTKFTITITIQTQKNYENGK